MGIVASARARLSQPDAVRAQMLAHLFIARVHNSIKSSYEQYLASTGNSKSDNQRPSSSSPMDGLQLEHTRRAEVYERRQVVDDAPGRRELELTRPIYHRKHLRSGGERPLDMTMTRAPFVERGWDWQGFPTLWRPLIVYDWFSTLWMSIASVQTIFHKQLSVLVEPLVSNWLLNGRPGRCLLLGRMVKPFGVSELLLVLVASFHLGWRLAQARAKRCRLLTMIVFLLASERDLERVWYASDGRGSSGGQLRPAHLDCATKDALSPSAAMTTAGQNERLFCQVMCYPVHRNKQVYFRLRPNRTREARKLLEQRVAAVGLSAFIFFAAGFSIASGIVLVCVLSDYRYARTYPGCTPELDECLARGELTYFSSFTLRDHHLLSMLVDLVENSMLWLDSGLSVTFVLALIYLLNYDLLSYWCELNRKLESLVQRSKYVHLTRLIQDNPSPSESIELDQLAFGFESIRQLEFDIHELQFELFDFFHQVRRADLLVGDILTYAILIWLSGCAFINYNLLMYNESSFYVSILIELLFVLGFFFIGVTTYHLLGLRRCCLGSYVSLCSLTAYDQTGKKRAFIKLMDFYLGARNSTTYHLCRTYAYQPTTFITIIGWSFSCFFIAFTLFKPQGNIR